MTSRKNPEEPTSIEDSLLYPHQSVLEMPPVTLKPKTGKWVFWDDDPDANTYECSECHEPYMLVEGTPEDNKYNFCPNCGAMMNGGERG